MKTIGIKLADGSFYSIMNDGEPCKKTLGLTTVKDNQTRIVVDLYRSKTSSMEDAEYVDTLQIDGLVPKQNGEADISLNIGLDEDNELHAELNDPETGLDTTTTVTLVSRTLEERLEPTNFEIVGDVQDTVEKKLEDDSAKNVAAGAAVGGGLLAAAALYKKQNEQKNTESEETKIEEIPEISEVEEPKSEEKAKTDETQIADDDFSLPDFSENDENADTIQSSDFDDGLNLPELENDFSPKEENNAQNEMNADEKIEETQDFSDPEKTSSVIDDAFATSDDDFNLPEIEEPIISDDDFSSDEKSDSLSEKEDNSLSDDDFSSLVNDNTPSNGINFNGLYDKETLEGNTESLENEEKDDSNKKKTKVSVIICIICAIICLIATILILFIVPSKYNLLNKKSQTEVQENVLPEEPLTVQDENENPAENTDENLVEEDNGNLESEEISEVEAKEDEVVVVSEPEQIIPEEPEVAEEKPQDIEYKIKWGDTLWDISDTYYKNPWKYKKIAKDNKIKNPDYIISGRKIVIKPLNE